MIIIILMPPGNVRRVLSQCSLLSLMSCDVLRHYMIYILCIYIYIWRERDVYSIIIV